jgi:hypothetical protein
MEGKTGPDKAIQQHNKVRRILRGFVEKTAWHPEAQPLNLWVSNHADMIVNCYGSGFCQALQPRPSIGRAKIVSEIKSIEKQVSALLGGMKTVPVGKDFHPDTLKLFTNRYETLVGDGEKREWFCDWATAAQILEAMRLTAVDVIENSANIPVNPEKVKKPKATESELANYLGEIYKTATDRSPVMPSESSQNDLWLELVREIFNALGLTGSPEHYARVVSDQMRAIKKGETPAKK